MKIVSITTVLLVITIVGLLFGQERRGGGQVLGVHYLQLRDNVSAYDFEQFVKYKFNPRIKAKAPRGLNLFFLKGIRGGQEGQYVLVWQIVSKKRRDEYWPAPDFDRSPLFEKDTRFLTSILAEYPRYVRRIKFTDYQIIQ